MLVVLNITLLTQHKIETRQPERFILAGMTLNTRLPDCFVEVGIKTDLFFRFVKTHQRISISVN